MKQISLLQFLSSYLFSSFSLLLLLQMQLARCGDQCGAGRVAAACPSLGGAGLCAVWQAAWHGATPIRPVFARRSVSMGSGYQ